MARAEHLAKWMRERVHLAAARGLVVGLSGGVDSAVVARLAQLAAPGNVVGVLLPCHSDPRDEHDAMRLAAHFSIPTMRIDLSATHDSLVAAAQPPLRSMMEHGRFEHADDLRARLPLANTKPRLRMTALYFLSNTLNYLVAGTGNRSEIAIGYFTKWGDGAADMLPLARLTKREVRALAQELGVPQGIVERVPSAGLWLGQTDEEEMGFTYADLERYLEEGPQGVAPALAMKIERLVRLSEHKREPVPMPEE
jgi:NAD+ synthase